MSNASGAGRDVVKQQEVEPALPIDQYSKELDALIAAHDGFESDRITPAIHAGQASRDVVRKVALESYCIGKWMTPELPVLIANSPDVYAFTMDHSTHYNHWAQNFADETGYRRNPNHVQMQVDWCRQMGLTDDDIRGYTPLAETIAMTFTMLFYVRRSYEEGLAVFGYAGERVAAGRGHARKMFEGLRDHYGVTVKTFEVHADAEPDRGGHASELFKLIATTRSTQERCRLAIRNVLLTAEARVRAMNRWVE